MSGLASASDRPPPETPVAPAGPSLADRIGMVVGSHFVTTIIGLVQSLLVVRLLSKEGYGTLAFVMMLYGTGRDLGLFAVPESILYFAAKVTPGQLKGLVRQSMLVLVGLGTIVGLILLGLSLAPALFLDGHTTLTPLLGLLALSSVIGFPASVYGNLFIATNNHQKTAGIALAMTLLGFAGAVVPAALGWSINFIVGTHTLTLGIRLVACELLYRKLSADVKREPFPGGWRAQAAYVVPLAVTRFAGIFNQKLDKFIVGLFFSAASFAEFSVGAQELPLVTILPYSIAQLMLPKLVELYEKSPTRLEGARAAVELWHTGIRKATLVMVPVAAFLLVAAEPLMLLLYGEKYLNAAVPFRIYTALLPLRVTGYGIMLMAFGQTRFILRVQLYGMVFNSAAAYVLLQTRLGMAGAPLAAVLTQASMIAYLLYRIDRVAKVGLRGIFPIGHYARVALAAIAAAALPIGGLWFVARVGPIVYLVASIPAFLAVYLTLAHVFGVLGAEDRAFVWRWIRLEPLRRKPPAGAAG